MPDLREVLIKADGRAAPYWEHWAYMVPFCVLCSMTIYLGLQYTGYTPSRLLPLLGVSLASVAAAALWTLDRKINYTPQALEEVCQESPPEAFRTFVVSCIVFAISIFIACQ